MKKHNLIIMLLSASFFFYGCSTMGSSSSSYSPGAAMATTATMNDPTIWKKSNNVTWQALQHTPLHSLKSALAANQDSLAKGWLSLAIISKEDSTNTPTLVNALENWRQHYPSHPGNTLFPNNSVLEQLSEQSTPHHIALLLPLHGSLAASGQVVRNGFLSAYYNNIGKTPDKQAISFYDTNETPDITALYQKAVNEGADIVIGPLTKPKVEALNHYGQFNVPVLALNYTQSSFFKSPPPHFYEFGLSPTEQARQVANKARAAGLSNALIIASDDSWGQRVTDALKSQWQSDGGKIIDTLYVTPHSNLAKDIASLLQINPKEDTKLTREDNSKAVLAEQRRQDFNVIFIFAQPDIGRQIVPLLRFYYAGNVPLYSISSIYTGRPNPSKDRDLNGVIFSELPWIIQMARTGASSPAQYDRLYALGRDAYLLSQNLSRLNMMPNFPIYGATGALALEQQQIYQRLPWVKMHGGQI